MMLRSDPGRGGKVDHDGHGHIERGGGEWRGSSPQALGSNIAVVKSYRRHPGAVWLFVGHSVPHL